MESYYPILMQCLLDTLLIPAIIWGAKHIARKSQDRQERWEKLEMGMLATLRQQYLSTAFYYIEKGWIPFSISDSMEQIYQAYHDLGGNGSVTSTRDIVLKLQRRV